MATDFIDQLRKATFPTERRGGYSTSAVSSYLNELADWLETGGDDQTRAALVQREMERVGERTGTILSATQESADRMTAEAEAEAKRVRSEASTAAGEARAASEKYSTETRAAADEHARTVTEAADKQSAEVLQRADDQARATILEADSRLQKAVDAAAERTRGVEEEIAVLIGKRGEVTANLEQLVTALRVTIDGPGSQDFDLPEQSERPVRRPADVLEAAPSSRDRLETVAEHRVVTESAPVAEPTVEEPSEPMTGEEAVEDGEDLGEGFAYEQEMDDQERQQRRRSAGESADQPTDETNLADLL